MSASYTSTQPFSPAGFPHFHYVQGRLHAEGNDLADIARQVSTPCYVYSKAAITSAWQAYKDVIGARRVLVCYGMKANSNLAILNTFRTLGSGFDIVSGGELARVLKVGADPQKIVFSGVGKQVWEIEHAIKVGVKCFNVESASELKRISQVATTLKTTASISLRVNPDVDAQTHPYISTGLKENKFGIAIEDALQTYQLAATLPGLKIVGVDCHIGSQITETAPYLDALDKILALIDTLKENGISLKHLDLGGGLGIRYDDETPLAPSLLLGAIFKVIDQRGYSDLELVFEPGRSLVGNAGVLLTTVQYLKHTEARNFAIVDAGMNDLIRPALYQAWHGVLPLDKPEADLATHYYDLVGPVCESADWLAKQRLLDLHEDQVLALDSAGAYGFVMACNYNTRGRPAEVLVDGSTWHIIRSRETFDDMIRGETLP
jgi:diaminopimelate decarboxylase